MEKETQNLVKTDKTTRKFDFTNGVPSKNYTDHIREHQSHDQSLQLALNQTIQQAETSTSEESQGSCS